MRHYRGRCYGYVPQHALNVGRLGAPGSDYDDGVLVVWTSTNPDGTGCFVVGWYEDARV